MRRYRRTGRAFVGPRGDFEDTGVVLGNLPCRRCRAIVYWGHSSSWTPKWGYGRVACRDAQTGRVHRCGGRPL